MEIFNLSPGRKEVIMIQTKLQNFITNHISEGATLLKEGDKLFQVLKEKHPDADKMLLTGDGK